MATSNIQKIYNEILEIAGITNPRDKLSKSKLSTLYTIKNAIENELPKKRRKIDDLRDIINSIKNGYRLDPHEKALSASVKEEMENELNKYRPEYNSLVKQDATLAQLDRRVSELIKKNENEKSKQNAKLSREFKSVLDTKIRSHDINSIISSYVGETPLSNNYSYYSKSKCTSRSNKNSSCVISGGKTRKHKYKNINKKIQNKYSKR